MREDPGMPPELHIAATTELPPALRMELRSFLDRAYDGEFTDDDWEHALGGHHVWRRDADGLVAHGSVVPRTLWTGGRRWQVGYVEAVATREDLRRRGEGAAVMRALAQLLRDRDQLGVLSSAAEEFYLGLGWERWRGPTWTAPLAALEDRGQWTRTEEDDGGIMILRAATTLALDLDGPLVCGFRGGDVW